MHRRVVWSLAVAACHVTTRSELTHPGTSERIRHPEGAVARHPTLVLTDAGRFRFVEPLDCPTEEIVADQRGIEIRRGPNLATFVVGVIATAAGGILSVRGANDADGASNPFTIAGIGLLAAGLPLAIGPWIGNYTELQPIADAAPTPRAGDAEPCGERALAATQATLAVRGVEVFGTIDRDGVFAVSPFDLVDAFEPPTAWSVTARVDSTRTVDVVLDGTTLAARAAAFLAHADFDPRIEPLRLVPGIVAGTLRVSLAQTAAGPAARIVLALENDGPGPTFALRGHVVAPTTPALDGRVMYFGRVEKGGTVVRELLVPVSAATADALRNATIDLALELRDAHGTAPTTPVRFHGAILVDAPR